ncbi:MAG: DMT family transporter [Rhodobacteraceae bacterium]|jgi:drug/metabolite transporter (DMT)-like permease|nr:DMT family transporter [Paracoccaceae bacterium]
MASCITDPVKPRTRALQGIACAEAGMLFFVVQDVMMKTMLETHSVWLLIFTRSVVSVLVLVPLIVVLGYPHRLRTALWPIHLLRGALFACGFSLFYAAFPFMGLAEVSTIFFSAPLFTALLAALFLGETIGKHRIAALTVGFAGVVIAVNPTASGFSPVAVMPLICAVFYAAGQVLARRIGDQESSLTVGLWTLAFSGVLIFPMGWVVNAVFPLGPEAAHLLISVPDLALTELPRLALLGLVGMSGYIFLSRAYQVAPASLVAPFDYTYLPIATVLAWWLWQEVPQTSTWAGMALITAAGIYLGLRELRATSDAPALVGETAFTPTAPPIPHLSEDETVSR